MRTLKIATSSCGRSGKHERAIIFAGEVVATIALLDIAFVNANSPACQSRFHSTPVHRYTTPTSRSRAGRPYGSRRLAADSESPSGNPDCSNSINVSLRRMIGGKWPAFAKRIELRCSGLTIATKAVTIASG